MSKYILIKCIRASILKFPFPFCLFLSHLQLIVNKDHSEYQEPYGPLAEAPELSEICQSIEPY